MPSRTTAPAWRGEFLRELARTGSVAAAAEAVGIDRSSAYQLRGRNPAFAASWDRAMADARAVLGQVQDGQAHDGQAQGEQGPGGDGADSGAGDGAGGRPRLRLRGDECVRASKAGRPCR